MKPERVKQGYDVLRKYGARWAVLAAMEIDLAKRDLAASRATRQGLKNSRMMIASGCFSICEVSCGLHAIEGELISLGATAGDAYVDGWMDLLAEAMSGKMDLRRITRIQLLKPVETSCGFLACKC